MFEGEHWVACERDCQPNLGPEFDPPPVYAIVGEEFSDAHWRQEPLEGERVVTPEGGAAKTSAEGNCEPPVGWFSTLWEGGPCG